MAHPCWTPVRGLTSFASLLAKMGLHVWCLRNPPFLPPGKLLGADVLPAEVYKKYAESLLPQLKQTLVDTLELGHSPPPMTEATIILLLKPAKNPLLPDSYKPISLLTTDIKLLARVLATHLLSIISKLIHRDQLGFIPSRPTA